jgi:hypothetical protein
VGRAMSQPRVANERGRKGGAMKVGGGGGWAKTDDRDRRVRRSMRKNKIEWAR